MHNSCHPIQKNLGLISKFIWTWWCLLFLLPEIFCYIKKKHSIRLKKAKLIRFEILNSPLPSSLTIISDCSVQHSLLKTTRTQFMSLLHYTSICLPAFKNLHDLTAFCNGFREHEFSTDERAIDSDDKKRCPCPVNIVWTDQYWPGHAGVGTLGGTGCRWSIQTGNNQSKVSCSYNTPTALSILGLPSI